MNPNICNECGLEYGAGQGRRCSACGAFKPEGLSQNEQDLLFSAYTLLRASLFEQAKTAFEDIIKKYPKNAFAYWGRLRSRYHIAFVPTGNGKSLPRCPTRSGAHLDRDVDYRKAMELADEDTKQFFAEQADLLNIFCSDSGGSKNVMFQFTMGEVDPNEKIPEKPKKSKKPVVWTVVLSLVLVFATVIGFSSGVFYGNQGEDTMASTTKGTTVKKPTPSASTTGATEAPPILPEEFNGSEKHPTYADVDFGGATFTLVGCDGEADGFNSAKEIYSEEADAISLSVRERNLLIETLYNCTIVGRSSPTPAQDAMIEVAANAHTIDIYTHHYSISGVATEGKVYNLLEIGTRDIDFSQPWWDQEYVNSYTVKNSAGKDTLYSIVGDFALTTFDCTHAIVYNKTVFQNDDDVNRIDIYQLVRDKKWTMDQFQLIIKNVANDANGDLTFDSQAGDIAGWIRTLHATHGLHTASGLSIMKTVNGVMSFDVDKNTESWSNVINKAIEIWAMPEGQSLSYTVIPETLAGGYALFASEILGNSLGNLKYYDTEIGLLPYPLYSETQENYAHYVDNHFYSYSVPTSVSDTDSVGDFLAVYAIHSTYIVRPAFINVYAYNYCADPDSAEMLEIILDTMTYDPGYLSASLEGEISNMISNGKNLIAQFAAKRVINANEWIEKFIAGIDDNNV